MTGNRRPFSTDGCWTILRRLLEVHGSDDNDAFRLEVLAFVAVFYAMSHPAAPGRGQARGILRRWVPRRPDRLLRLVRAVACQAAARATSRAGWTHACPSPCCAR
jgi:hypothetical protein